MYPTLEQKEQVINALKGPQFDRRQHGALFDRGSADSYYGRARDPHYWPQGTAQGVPIVKLNEAEVEEYLAGYDWNEQYGDKKSWD
jgi:hypothetical protein